MHTEQSTCNPDMVWPSTVTPGCKCISRAEAAEQVALEAAAPPGSGSSDGGEQSTQKSKVVKEAVKKVATPAKPVAIVEVHSRLVGGFSHDFCFISKVFAEYCSVHLNTTQ